MWNCWLAGGEWTCVQLCNSASLFGFYHSGQQKLCCTFQVWRTFTEIRASTILGRAGGTVLRKPFSVFVSLIQGPCLAALWLRTGESSQACSVAALEELTFDAVEIWEATAITATSPDAAHRFHDVPDLGDSLVTLCVSCLCFLRTAVVIVTQASEECLALQTVTQAAGKACRGVLLTFSAPAESPVPTAAPQSLSVEEGRLLEGFVPFFVIS